MGGVNGTVIMGQNLPRFHVAPTTLMRSQTFLKITHISIFAGAQLAPKDEISRVSYGSSQLFSVSLNMVRIVHFANEQCSL
jgi:hypothetical protein